MTHLGDRLRIARRNRGLSLERLAPLAVMSSTYIWELESGRVRNPTVRTLLNLATALDIDLSALAMAAFQDQPRWRFYGQHRADKAADS